MRRSTLIKSCAMMTAVGIVAGGSVPGPYTFTSAVLAAVQPPASDLLTLEVTDLPLKTVIQSLTRDSGVDIILADSEKMNTLITANIRQKPLETILQNIVTTAGVGYTRRADGTYVIGSDISVSDTSTAPVTDVVAAPVVAVSEPVNVAPVKRTRVERIPLQHINPIQAMTRIGALPAEVAFNPGNFNSFKPIKKLNFETPTPLVDLYEISDFQPGRVTNTNASAVNPTTQVTGAVPVAPTTDSFSAQTANRTSDSNMTANQYRPPTSTRTGTTQAPGTTSTTRPGGVTSSGTSDNLRPEGIEAIIPFDQENALLVKGEDDAVQELKDLITLVDVPPKQVMIKAEFVEVNTSETRRLGLDWVLSRPNSVVQTDFRPSGNVLAYVQSGNLTANIRAELTSGGGKVVNAPIISTLNNTAATISVGRQIPFYQSVTQNNGNTLVTTSQVTYIDASTELNVLPQINGDNSITLIMQPRVSDSTQFVQGPNGEEAPIITQQQLSTARRVANGETIVVGGFIKKNDSNGGSRVPLLADLPIIGRLFRSDFNINNDTETLIFITPTVIEDRGGGTAVGVIAP